MEDWCADRGIPCFTGTGDTRALMEAEGLSLEEAARKLRYAFLEETARREGFAPSSPPTTPTTTPRPCC
ncbi:MAG: hypothetical protein V8R40_02635 [Dysosmobacter sp.]